MAFALQSAPSLPTGSKQQPLPLGLSSAVAAAGRAAGIATRNAAGVPSTRGKGPNNGPAPVRPAPKSKASPAPAAAAAAAKASATVSGAPTSAQIISAYNLARAKILQGMAPQVSGIYTDAAKSLTDSVGASANAMRGHLGAWGNQASHDMQAQLGGLTGVLGTDVTPSYNPDTASAASYALGAAFPGESLAKQAGGFGAAAAFAPERALTEGQYALQAQLTAEARFKAAAAVKGALTPYQKYQIGRNSVKDDQAWKLAVAKFKRGGQLTPYEIASLSQRDKSYGLAVQKANDLRTANAAKGAQVNTTKSKQTGVIYLNDGTLMRQPNGHTVKFTDYYPNAPKTGAGAGGLTVSAKNTLSNEAQAWHDGTTDKGGKLTTTYDKNGKATTSRQGSTPGKPKIGYQAALRRLRGRGLNLLSAQDILDPIYKKGEMGRPWADYQERDHLLKSGYPRTLVTKLQNNEAAYKVFLSLLPAGADILHLQRFSPAIKVLLKQRGLI